MGNKPVNSAARDGKEHDQPLRRRTGQSYARTQYLRYNPKLYPRVNENDVKSVFTNMYRAASSMPPTW